jgi:citrate lyase subunit beta / citryl-CoA lyase
MKLRSMLYVPAHSERFLAKAHERGADAIILDLEDAVPEADKDRARDGLVEAAKSVRRNGARVFVRINSGERRRADAEAAANAGANGLVLAKAELAELGSFSLPTIAMLEGPAAVLDARDYAKHPGVLGLLVGSEDLATALGATPTPDVLRTPKLLVHYAAKAEGKLSFGLLRSVADYADLSAIEAAGREAREHGFDGATCVHPSVVPILNTAFAPDETEIAWAERVVHAAKSGAGAFTVDGRMVDAPVIARARRILDL